MNTFSFQATWHKQIEKNTAVGKLFLEHAFVHRGIREFFSGCMFIFFGLNLFGKLVGWDKKETRPGRKTVLF